MSKPFAIGFACAVVVLVGAVAWILSSHSGNYLAPTGKILQVRTVALDPASSALVIDFEVTNPSGREMIVRFINVKVTEPDGSTPDNSMIAATDLPAMFRYHTELGPLKMTPMRERDHISPGQIVQRVTAVRYDLTEAQLKQRKGVELEIVDVTGPKLELAAK